jgi:hypothetical protein
VAVIVGDAGDQGVEIERRFADWFDDDAPGFLSHLDNLTDGEVGRRYDRRGDADSPLPRKPPALW